MVRLIFIFLGLILSLLPLNASCFQRDSESCLVVVDGVVKSARNKKPLGEVRISLQSTPIATVSNADGHFQIKFPSTIKEPRLKAEALGFANLVMPLKTVGEEISLFLEPVSYPLPSVTIKTGDPTAIVTTALELVPKNYSDKKNRFSAFYRETVQKRNRFLSVSEAVVDLVKTSYGLRSTMGERVRVAKGRKALSEKASDTIAVKIVGGPTLPINLDMAKNPDFLFSDVEELRLYAFKMQQPTMIDDRLQFVISFSPIGKADYPLYEGTLYIDQETLAFTRAEFSADMSDRSKVTRAMLVSHPRGLRFKPLELSYVVSYNITEDNADEGETTDSILTTSYLQNKSKDAHPRWALSYISARSRFKCDWHRRLFSSPYSTNAEIVIIDSQAVKKNPISRKEAFSQREIFSDGLTSFSDPDFWADYNTILPTETLEQALPRLLKAQKKK